MLFTLLNSFFGFNSKEVVVQCSLNSLPNVTIEKLLKTALQPVGTTLYIYGGGWNEEDTGAGKATTTIGVSPSWKKFYDLQDKTYNYKNHNYEIENGLDCTGYVGWLLYNLFNTEDGSEGYVYPSKDFANQLLNKGWGSVIKREDVKSYKPGDIMCSDTFYHVWVVIGECKDGSVVLLHSSPPGVRICGTTDLFENNNSKAIQLAEQYMSKYYGDFYNKFPDCRKPMEYLTGYDQFKWDMSSDLISDPDGYLNMTAEQVLENLFK